MGVIIKQSMFASTYAYIGVTIGFVISALIMPKILLPEQIGIIKLITALVGIFTAIFSMGANQLLYRIFPHYENEIEKRRTLVYYVLKIILFGILLAIPFYLFFSPRLMNIEEVTADLDKNLLFFSLLFFAVAARIIYQGAISYIRMLNNITIDSLVQNIYQKGAILLVLLFFHFQFFSFNSFIIIYLCIYISLPLALILLFSFSFKTPLNAFQKLIDPSQREAFNKSEKKDFFNLLLFGILTSIGGSLYLYIDTLMVNEFLSESEVGIYGTVFLFGMVVIIPARTLTSISVSILSKAFKVGDHDEIKMIYKKSSLNLMIIGGYLFLGVWCNRYSIFGYLPEEFEIAKMVVFHIGLAQLIDMSLGVNNEIIAVSSKYKMNTYFIILAIIIAVISNTLLIPRYGINGAGIATLVTVLGINIVRLLYILLEFKIQPFSKNSFVILAILCFTFLLLELTPNTSNLMLNLIIKGTLISAIYVPAIYFSRASIDFNDIIKGLLKRFGVYKA
jgi:O-antigen/teichoic acid export membrane protein